MQLNAPREKSVLFLEHVKEHIRLEKEYRKQYVSAIAMLVKKHYKTLKMKYDQLVYQDDYGNVIYDDFDREFDYFVEKVLFKEIDFFSMSDSYNKILMEAMSLRHTRYEYIASEFKYRTNQENLFAFTIKPVEHEIADIRISKSDEEEGAVDIETFVPLDFKIIEDQYAKKDQEFMRDILSYYYTRVKYIAATIFGIIMERAIIKFPGVKKMTQEIPNSPLEYERYVAEYLKNLGFDTRTTKASGDQGADVLAEKDGVSFAIQCKKYSKPVGNKAVQEANAGRDFYKCNYGVVVSNAGFTKSARTAANACKIILLNDKQLDKLLKYTTA